MSVGASTIYDVRLRYMIEDRAARGVRTLGGEMAKAARSNNLLEGGFRRIAALAAGAFGFVAAKRTLIDFNSDMEKARITMAGLFEMNMGGSFADNMQRANSLVGGLQERMKHAAGTTKEAVEMAAMLAQGFGKSGASLKQMEDMTVGAVVGAKAMGIAADVAARDVDQALRGQFRSVDQFTGKLLGSKEFGFQGEDGRRRFNAMSDAKRFDVMNRALNQKSLRDMANAQSQTWEGVSSTFQDGLEIALGKVGLPLFQRLTQEVKSWNQWMDKNSDAIAKFSRDFGDTLVGGFEVVKSVMSFIIEHKDLLMTIAKMWVAAKIAGGVAGAFSNGAGGLATMIGQFQQMAGILHGGTGVVTGMSRMGSMLATGGMVLGGLAALGLAAQGIADWMSKRQSEQIQKREAGNVFLPRALEFANKARGMEAGKEATAQARQAFALLKSSDLVDEKGRVNRDALKGILQEMGTKERTGLAGQLGYANPGHFSDVGHVMEMFVRRIETMMSLNPAALQSTALPQAVIDAQTDGKTKKDRDINVTIQRIEVQSDDPDRFVMGLSETISNTLRYKAVPMGALREG